MATIISARFRLNDGICMAAAQLTSNLVRFQTVSNVRADIYGVMSRTMFTARHCWAAAANRRFNQVVNNALVITRLYLHITFVSITFLCVSIDGGRILGGEGEDVRYFSSKLRKNVMRKAIFFCFEFNGTQTNTQADTHTH